MARSPTHDPKDVFLQALRFDYSRIVLTRSALHWARLSEWRHLDGGTMTFALPTSSMPPTFVTALVCSVFSVELYLKTIMCLEASPIPQKHELDVLFGALPQPWIEKLRAAYATEIALPEYVALRENGNYPKDIESNIGIAAKAFVKWRYLFEGSLPGYWIDPVRNAILKSIIVAKPEWEQLRRDLNTPPTPPAETDQAPIDELQWILDVGTQLRVQLPQPALDSEEGRSEQSSPPPDRRETERSPPSVRRPEGE